MGYAVVHMTKIKGGALGGIQSHMNREHPPKTNPDVDTSRSEFNYDLVACDNFKKTLKEKISSLVVSDKAVRSDAVVACNFVVTSDFETMMEMPAEKQYEFFQETVKWFADRYGADRILNATVHMDENTPHLHLGIVPITKDGRLSAKSIFDREELRNIQSEFPRDVAEKYGLVRGIEGSQNKHLSEMDYKVYMAEQKEMYLEIEIENKVQKLTHLNGKVWDSENDIQKLREEKESTAQVLNYKLEELEVGVEYLTRDAQVLKDEIEGLEGEVSSLKGLKQGLKEEVEISKAVLTQEYTRGAATLGDMSSYKEAIENERKKRAQNEKLSLLEKFINLPFIKPLWEKFFQEEKQKGHTPEQDRGSGRGR